MSKITIKTNGDSIVVCNSDGMEYVYINWQCMPNLGYAFKSRIDCINVLIGLVHGSPSAELKISDHAINLIDKVMKNAK